MRKIGYLASEPAADFVAEDPQPTERLHPHRTFGHDASSRAKIVRDWCHFDAVATLVGLSDQR